jgi:hypothetical protein
MSTTSIALLVTAMSPVNALQIVTESRTQRDGTGWGAVKVAVIVVRDGPYGVDPTEHAANDVLAAMTNVAVGILRN